MLKNNRWLTCIPPKGIGLFRMVLAISESLSNKSPSNIETAASMSDNSSERYY